MISEIKIKDQSILESLIKDNKATAVYISTAECGVCKVLKPKLLELLSDEFPLFSFVYIDAAEAKEIAAQQNVFAVPTVLFFFEGKELIRKSRNINLGELYHEIKRPYELIHSTG